MLKLRPLLLVLVCALVQGAPPSAALPEAPPVQVAPPLLPGEDLALAGPDGELHGFGHARRESPLGSLASLLWLKLEGAEWTTQGVGFKCTGALPGLACSNPKGHGKVDLPKALAVGCDLAMLVWCRTSVVSWRKDYGDGAARARLEDAFGPFLGNRMPPGENLPRIDGNWIWEGTLLRGTPESLVSWLMDPAQDEVLRRLRRLLLTAFQENFQGDAWWILTGTAEVPMEPGAKSAWAVGGNGSIIAVLRLPSGNGRAEAMARFRAVMIPPVQKKK
jgi:hypothetical protein